MKAELAQLFLPGSGIEMKLMFEIEGGVKNWFIDNYTDNELTESNPQEDYETALARFVKTIPGIIELELQDE